MSFFSSFHLRESTTRTVLSPHEAMRWSEREITKSVSDVR
eukprot:CAMPEP_0202062500 /NCGR_PEP_ID=MMETSP0963-20130614/44029_1 /ASSEMBLY_ACC=CAM_ASM_000494 /TAXON_ID=4773 /ORGANISM="Schizochytrium aggregatum, Strain ATCC28209" /LENGTH=39 /DNA_ID= /DNA_START= /DNA_END= /DNA_ORIENTATION=